jgi:hypothetical protein
MMSDKLRAAAQAALDALERSSAVQLRAAISLRAALAEPTVQESLIVAEPAVKKSLTTGN